jgi:hypothetical protein
MLPEPVRDWLKPYQGFGTLQATNVEFGGQIFGPWTI